MFIPLYWVSVRKIGLFNAAHIKYLSKNVYCNRNIEFLFSMYLLLCFRFEFKGCTFAQYKQQIYSHVPIIEVRTFNIVGLGLSIPDNNYTL